jgi:3-deoxy-manno-octulosonate cytidylyltransferase (CMP-KDO synthetase)
MSFLVAVPARYASVRLPGKPLLELAGRPMILHVVAAARRADAREVFVATDDERIATAVREHGTPVELTSPDHASGTDRIAEVVRRRGLPGDAIVVNVQGDEPLIEPERIREVAAALQEHPAAGMATLATPIRRSRDVFDPNVVKVVTAADGMALYFSRAPIPWVRDEPARPAATGDEPLSSVIPFWRHVGLYAYRVEALLRLAAHPPVAIERAERLEQLRALALGIGIHVVVTDHAPGPGVDTAADLAEVERILLERARIGSARR